MAVNVFSTAGPLNVSSTSGRQYAFGFGAVTLRIFNASSVDLYADFTGNLPSTGGTAHVIKTTDKFEAAVPRLQSLGLTTTSTGAGGAQVYVLALGD